VAGMMACNTPAETPGNSDPYVIVLGVAQDAGFPQAGCTRVCCEQAWRDPGLQKMVSCLGIVDPETMEAWIIDATPNFRDQMRLLNESRGLPGGLPEGIFLTHAHIGHFTGLIHLGREVMGANEAKVYAMPRMKNFLETNGPWSLIDSFRHMELMPMFHNEEISLNSRLHITPFLVPHRDELSETVGFRIRGPASSLIYIPDIDKWNIWDQRIEILVERNDFLLVDGTFFANGEIPGRDMSLIPHPFVEESMDLLDVLSDDQRSKVHFIHLNHTNPLLLPGSEESEIVGEKGYGLTFESQRFPL
jgi:pyrroloquinoline quinone biosynthesis protein B